MKSTKKKTIVMASWPTPRQNPMGPPVRRSHRDAQRHLPERLPSLRSIHDAVVEKEGDGGQDEEEGESDNGLARSQRLIVRGRRVGALRSRCDDDENDEEGNAKDHGVDEKGQEPLPPRCQRRDGVPRRGEHQGPGGTPTVGAPFPVVPRSQAEDHNRVGKGQRGPARTTAFPRSGLAPGRLRGSRYRGRATLGSEGGS